MNRLSKIVVCFMAAAIFLVGTAAPEQELKETRLPKPDKTGGKPLMQALNQRCSNRAYKSMPLPETVLSNLLWAAWGINRADANKRTAPSAVNWQEIDVYVLTADAVHVYDAARHSLRLVKEGDVRSQVSKLKYIPTAPVNLIYVADFSKMRNLPENEKLVLSAANAGHISQNVYLFCASEELGAVVYHRINQELLAKALDLRPEQRAILGQCVGYPKEQPRN